MPEPLAGPGVNRDERVGEQVVALAIAAVEVVARTPEPEKCDAVLLIDGELAPVVPAAATFQWPSGHVSYPNSPSCGMTWKIHASFPVRTS